MVENNKIKALEKYGRKVGEQIQHLQENIEEHRKKT
jgi:chaperonin cofactor prefoldin